MQNNNRIRKITETIFGREPMTYIVGKPRILPINGKNVSRVIAEILKTETSYKIYISNEDVTKEWIDMPKSDRITVEYFID